MPLVGGGGAPNVSGGSNPAGTGTGLNYVGNHCYAFSGEFEASTSQQTMLLFTTSSNNYIVSKIQMNGYIDVSNIGGGALGAFIIKIDEQIVGNYKITGSTETAPYSIEADLVLPASSKVEVICVSSTTSADFKATTTITGRVY